MRSKKKASLSQVKAKGLQIPLQTALKTPDKKIIQISETDKKPWTVQCALEVALVDGKIETWMTPQLVWRVSCFLCGDKLSFDDPEMQQIKTWIANTSTLSVCIRGQILCLLE